MGARHYAAHTALAHQSPGISGPSVSSVSPPKSSSSRINPERINTAVVKDEHRKRRTTKGDPRSAHRALKEAQETERRRKALATLDKTTKFMAAGLHDSLEPTLTDLDRLKPTGPPLITLDFVYPELSPHFAHGSPTPSIIKRYCAAFQKLVDTMTSKFRRKQLLRLYREGIQKENSPFPGKPKSVGSLKTSRDVASEIIRWLWHWPHVKEVEERMRYLTSRSEREFLISTSEFFLLLGPDGSSLQALTESHGITVKGVKRTEHSDAFSLVVEGLSFKLDQLAVVLAERRKRIISELVHLESDASSSRSSVTRGNSIRPDLLPRISKLTNALVEDLGNDMFRISADHTQNIMMARRLVARAFQQGSLPHPSLLARVSTSEDSIPELHFPRSYALFPFELSSEKPLPFYWTPTRLLTQSSESVVADLQDHTKTLPADSQSQSILGSSYKYRVRKVSGWLEQRPSKAISNDDLGEGISRLIDWTGHPHKLRNALGLPDLDSPESSQSQPVKVTASLGHIVFAPAVRQKSLLPPLRGSWSLPVFFDWMKGNEAYLTFIPGLPNSSVTSSPTSQVLLLSRLVYRSFKSVIPRPGKQLAATASHSTLLTLNFEIQIPESIFGRKNLDTRILRGHDGLHDTNTSVRSMFDEQSTLIRRQPSSDEDSAEAADAPLDARSNHNTPQLWEGVENIVNVMLPDRRIDMQLSSFESIPVVSGSEPPELRDYASNLTKCLLHTDFASRPVPPLHVTYKGMRYVLDTNATVRSSSYVVPDYSTEQLDVKVEHAVDFESNQHSDACFVVCSEPNITIAWNKFLGACDRLTRVRAGEGIMYSDQGSTGADILGPNKI